MSLDLEFLEIVSKILLIISGFESYLNVKLMQKDYFDFLQIVISENYTNLEVCKNFFFILLNLFADHKNQFDSFLFLTDVGFISSVLDCKLSSIKYELFEVFVNCIQVNHLMLRYSAQYLLF